MRPRHLLPITLGTIALILPAAPAVAADNGTVQSGGCPASRTLATVSTVIGAIDWRPYSDAQRAENEALLASTAVDRNQDGLLCYSAFQQSAGRDKKYGATDYSLLAIGDNAVVGR